MRVGRKRKRDKNAEQAYEILCRQIDASIEDQQLKRIYGVLQKYINFMRDSVKNYLKDLERIVNIDNWLKQYRDKFISFLNEHRLGICNVILRRLGRPITPATRTVTPVGTLGSYEPLFNRYGTKENNDTYKKVMERVAQNETDVPVDDRFLLWFIDFHGYTMKNGLRKSAIEYLNTLGLRRESIGNEDEKNKARKVFAEKLQQALRKEKTDDLEFAFMPIQQRPEVPAPVKKKRPNSRKKLENDMDKNMREKAVLQAQVDTLNKWKRTHQNGSVKDEKVIQILGGAQTTSLGGMIYDRDDVDAKIKELEKEIRKVNDKIATANSGIRSAQLEKFKAMEFEAIPSIRHGKKVHQTIQSHDSVLLPYIFRPYIMQKFLYFGKGKLTFKDNHLLQKIDIEQDDFLQKLTKRFMNMVGALEGSADDIDNYIDIIATAEAYVEKEISKRKSLLQEYQTLRNELEAYKDNSDALLEAEMFESFDIVKAYDRLVQMRDKLHDPKYEIDAYSIMVRTLVFCLYPKRMERYARQNMGMFFEDATDIIFSNDAWLMNSYRQIDEQLTQDEQRLVHQMRFFMPHADISDFQRLRNSIKTVGKINGGDIDLGLVMIDYIVSDGATSSALELSAQIQLSRSKYRIHRFLNKQSKKVSQPPVWTSALAIPNTKETSTVAQEVFSLLMPYKYAWGVQFSHKTAPLRTTSLKKPWPSVKVSDLKDVLLASYATQPPGRNVSFKSVWAFFDKVPRIRSVNGMANYFILSQHKNYGEFAFPVENTFIPTMTSEKRPVGGSISYGNSSLAFNSVRLDDVELYGDDANVFTNFSIDLVQSHVIQGRNNSYEEHIIYAIGENCVVRIIVNTKSRKGLVQVHRGSNIRAVTFDVNQMSRRPIRRSVKAARISLNKKELNKHYVLEDELNTSNRIRNIAYDAEFSLLTFSREEKANIYFDADDDDSEVESSQSQYDSESQRNYFESRVYHDRLESEFDGELPDNVLGALITRLQAYERTTPDVADLRERYEHMKHYCELRISIVDHIKDMQFTYRNEDTRRAFQANPEITSILKYLDDVIFRFGFGMGDMSTDYMGQIVAVLEETDDKMRQRLEATIDSGNDVTAQQTTEDLTAPNMASVVGAFDELNLRF